MSKRIKFIIILLINIAVLFTAYFLNTNHLITTLLVFGIPGIFLIIQIPKRSIRILIFALLATILWGPAFDVITTLNGMWLTQKSTIGITLFNLSPIENWIWLFLIIVFALSFYESFLDKGRAKVVIKKFDKIAIFLGALFSIGIFTAYLANQHMLISKYAYIFIGITNLVIPSIVYYWLNPSLLKKSIPVSFYFFLYFLSYEYVAVGHGHWTYGNQLLGNITIGSVSFPLEELIFWMIFSIPLCIAGYEYLVDDNK